MTQKGTQLHNKYSTPFSIHFQEKSVCCSLFTQKTNTRKCDVVERRNARDLRSKSNYFVVTSANVELSIWSNSFSIKLTEIKWRPGCMCWRSCCLFSGLTRPSHLKWVHVSNTSYSILQNKGLEIALQPLFIGASQVLLPLVGSLRNT